ncbi:MAG: lipoyl synthase [Candidatus Aminicenantes bacterium]|nr:lipoyl synthase [Candidatus Aminicenantes bacterium]NIM78735.1 lipoyl synthase [Candidatus Aminicenantes bacterium]NIN17990.1 lipoyl synthase [Candidatus Aminicenantes bacterium]NIN41890.1 lipoyl synthase [Candidatus Aminicenantes bacterium]NIN84645.1 lipoyl synthase [Candidatus Aminicenantes bacterium]
MRKIGNRKKQPKPKWLKAQIPGGEDYFRIKKNLEKRGLSTICQRARCPNISECWNNYHATFLIMGDTCSRNCTFCSVKSGNPAPLHPEEAQRVLEMVEIMKSTYVVITSVTRDDLEDGGSSHFAGVIALLKARRPGLKIEVLIPDFKGNTRHVDTVLDAGPDVLNHNLETVRRLYPHVNRKPENYHISLEVLRYGHDKGFITKSGIMVGLGETIEEIKETLQDLRESGVELLTIGQYLQATRENVPVEKFYTPEEFEELKEMAFSCGFRGVESGPFVRSSYKANKMYMKANGL